MEESNFASPAGPIPEQVHDRITRCLAELTPKGRILADFILQAPRKAVFMTTKELAAACGVSEATVVRFVGQIGYAGYGEFLQALRDSVDTELTLLDRVGLSDAKGPGGEAFRDMIAREIDNLRQLFDAVDMATVEEAVALLGTSPSVHVIGSRLSYILAYYMGWSLMKVRPDVHILKGSDSTILDRLTAIPADAMVVILTVSRYPNELVRVARNVRRLGLRLMLITDSALCPLLGFSHLNLIAPSKHIPVLGNPTTLSCLINHLTLELARRGGASVKAHQERLEQSYRENDILFNLHRRPDGVDVPS